jgi:hypothetical protein
MGYLGWDSRYLSGVPHLDGVEWTEQGHPLGMSWKEAEEDEPFLIQTASGESVVQSVYSGVAASDKAARLIFDLPFQLINEDSFRRLKMASAKGEAVNFVPHIWEMDHFSDAGVADLYSLTHPVAWTVAAGVTSVTHPAVYYKDGVIDTNCVSLSGTLSQTVTVAEAGDIAVWYMPVFRVMVKGIQFEFQDVNGVTCSFALEEVRRYA